jgi:ParB family chromosome partitioning protein
VSPTSDACRLAWLGDADGTVLSEPDTDVDGTNGSAVNGAVDGGGVGSGSADDDGEDEEAVRPLSDRLVQDLTAERTLALRNALAADPDVAIVAALHAMVLQLFYRFASGSCLEISLKSTGFPQVQGLGETIWASEIADRHEGWDRDLPDEEHGLWDFLLRLDETSRKSLFAHCIALTLNVVIEPWNRRPRALAHGDVVAGALGFDMVSAGWTAGVDNYLGKVTKARILEAVRQACGEDAAQQIGHLKKQDMAKAAARLLEGSNWLPEPLRNRDAPSGADDRGGEQSAGNDEASGHPLALSDEERGSDPMMAAAE